ncbi:arsenate reductase ArsC [Chryseobacterium sp. SN22]|uniref:arsenate reductase ArsC n=1 Tax=Chryseobacterium sp. SN22 TaxID=2606431 RepID=UPI0011ED332D|nr:arsenate reductase ArsC [Chryseobacterium sp. SN22]KAA0130353.1 arsenate reductase ArsC [Chryseobacterium sp. SN22]
MKKKIFVLCTGNSCRSQIAEGYLRYFAGDRAEIYSAGIETHGLNPEAVATMKEDGIDISRHTSNHIDEYRHLDFDFVITVCDHAKENCPYFPSKTKSFHQNFPDPAKAMGRKEEICHAFKNVREEIKKYCENFIKENL